MNSLTLVEVSFSMFAAIRNILKDCVCYTKCNGIIFCERGSLKLRTLENHSHYSVHCKSHGRYLIPLYQ